MTDNYSLSSNKNNNSKENIISKEKIKYNKTYKSNNQKKVENLIDNNIKLNLSISSKNQRKSKKNYSIVQNKSLISKKYLDSIEKNNNSIEKIEEFHEENDEINKKEKDEKRKEQEVNKKEKEEKEEKIEKNYFNIIKDLESQILEIKEFYSKKITNLNLNIKQKDSSIISLTNSNNSLRHALELLTLRVDKILYNSKNNKNLNNNFPHCKSSSDISLDHQLKVKEKELNNQQKLINILRNDNKNIKSVVERYNLVDVNINLSDKLHEKEMEIKNLQKQMHIYELKIEEHNLCSDKIKNLNEEILSYKKEIELQKIDVKKNHKNYNELKNKLDKYGIPIEKLKFFRNQNNMKKSEISRNININTFRNSTKNNSIDYFSLKNENKKGNITDRQVPKKIHYYNSISPIKKKEISKNEVKINQEGLINILSSEEIIIIKKLFDDDEEKFSNFIKKINIIEKYISIKEKEMNQNIKLMENKLKKNKILLQEAQNIIKQKTNELLKLNSEIKDLNQVKVLLIQKIKDINNSLNKEKNNNKILKDENEKLKNSVFNIEGIIGSNIIKEKNDYYNSKEKSSPIFNEENNKIKIIKKQNIIEKNIVINFTNNNSSDISKEEYKNSREINIDKENNLNEN